MGNCKFLPGASRLLVSSLFVVLVACSSSGGSTPPTAAPTVEGTAPSAPAAIGSPAPTAGRVSSPPPAASGAEVKLTVKNNTFPEEIRVKAGAKVVFVVTNQGDETHSFELPDFKVYQEIKPGQTERIEWTVPNQKGKWDMGCFLTQPDVVHDGMEGDLIIE